MVSTKTIAQLLQNIEALFSAFTIFIPGIIAYFIYVGLRSQDFDKIKTSHWVLIVLFTLFFQILSDISGRLMNNIGYLVGFYFIFPIIIGFISDIAHRVFVSVCNRWYQENIIEGRDYLDRIDVGNISRWQNTLPNFAFEEEYKEYYVELKVEDGEGSMKIKGFLNGYSDDDIELIRYDKSSEKDYTGIGTLDEESLENELTQRHILIPRDKICSLSIYRIRMSDFFLK